ncbi:hypothetical protein JCM18916_1518 [Cutibacterium acnes JCM 18916]|nr:hypothetical protein JCM18916_1518 [Cutibacterium acnes JCM 18916]
MDDLGRPSRPRTLWYTRSAPHALAGIRTRGHLSADESYVTASQTEAQCLIAAKPIREPDKRRW